MERDELVSVIKAAVREAVQEALRGAPDQDSREFRREPQPYWLRYRNFDFQNTRMEMSVSRLENVMQSLETWAPSECNFTGCELECAKSREP